MAADDGFLVVNHFSNSDTQKWLIAGNRICKFVDPDQVLDVFEANADPGTQICKYDFHGGPNQLWTFEHLYATRTYFVFSCHASYSYKLLSCCSPAEFFFIVSQLNEEMCLDVSRGDPEPKTRILTWTVYVEEGRPHQLWYEDKHAYIRSKLNDLVMDANSTELLIN